MNDSPPETIRGDDFARQIDAVVASCVHTLAQLSALRVTQRQDVLALAMSAEVPPKFSALSNGANDEARVKALKERAQATAATDPGSVNKAGALEQLYRAVAHATTLALYNAVAAQQQIDLVAQAVLAARATRELQKVQPAPALATSTPPINGAQMPSRQPSI